jgi:alpha-ketoglutarate-dependent taurine dioxygenase
VIFFRDQDLTPEQHINFAQRWGKIMCCSGVRSCRR